MKINHNKLVRDNIPTIIKQNHKTSSTRILNEQEYIQELKKKLIEESNEVFHASSKQEVCEEIADVFEVLEALQNVYGLSNDEILEVKTKKALKNGKFEKRIYLEYVKSED